jgi:hypothetical protein
VETILDFPPPSGSLSSRRCPMFPSFRAPETMTAAEQSRLLKATEALESSRDLFCYPLLPGSASSITTEVEGLRGGRAR